MGFGVDFQLMLVHPNVLHLYVLSFNLKNDYCNYIFNLMVLYLICRWDLVHVVSKQEPSSYNYCLETWGIGNIILT